MRFRLTDISGAEGYLALQIREVHNIEIDQSNVPDASRGKVQAQGRAKSACTDQKHFGGFQLELPLHSDFRHDQVAAIAEDLFVGEAGCCGMADCWPCFSRHDDLLSLLPSYAESVREERIATLWIPWRHR